MGKKKLNCWDMKDCGRCPGGSSVSELGVCPVCLEKKKKTNGGKAGGRICWAIAGSFCGGQIQGSFAEKLNGCIDCNFFKHVKMEEGASFRIAP